MKTCTIIDSIEKMYKPTNPNFADILTSGYFYYYVRGLNNIQMW